MEFEEMQVIWNSQNEETMYAINEAALYEQIKRKGRSINRLAVLSEAMMMGANLIVALILLVDALLDSGQPFQYVLAALYLAYSIFALFRRRSRRQEVVRFENTMLGELDRALWQVNYLIRQGRSSILWYLLPLLLVGALTMVLNDNLIWAAALFLLLPVTYVAGRWEIQKFYLPKKRALESLRETLLAANP